MLRQELEPEALSKIFRILTVHLSAPGDQVAYTTTPATKECDHDLSQIHLAIPGKKHSSRPLTSGLYNDISPCFSPQELVIAFISDRAKQGESSAIYLITPNNSNEAFPITPTENNARIKNIKWSPCGTFIAFSSPDNEIRGKERKEKDDVIVYGQEWPFHRLRVVHIKTHDVRTVDMSDVEITGIVWGEDSKTIICFTTKTPEVDSPLRYGTDIAIVNLTTGQNGVKYHFPGECENPVYKDGNVYFQARVRPESDCSSWTVYCLDLRIAPEPKRFIKNTDYCVATIRPSNMTPVAIHIQNGLEDGVYSVDTLGNQTRLYAGLGLITAYDAHTGPRSSTSKGKGEAVPIIPLHGGPYHRSTVHFSPDHLAWIPYLLSAGYAVLLANYRGGSGHGDDYAAYAMGGMGSKDYEDLMVVLRKAFEQNSDLDVNRVAIGGWSSGGFLSFLSTVRGVKAAADAVLREDRKRGVGEEHSRDDKTSPFHFRAAVCGAGITDWDMLCMNSDCPVSQSQLCGTPPWSSPKTSISGRQGSAIWEMAPAASAVELALASDRTVTRESILTPALILHGEKDARVPLAQAIAFREGCLKHDWPFEMATYPREPHRVVERDHVLDMLKRVRRFLDLHLK